MTCCHVPVSILQNAISLYLLKVQNIISHCLQSLNVKIKAKTYMNITNGIFSEVNLITCTFQFFLSYVDIFIIRALMLGN